MNLNYKRLFTTLTLLSSFACQHAFANPAYVDCTKLTASEIKEALDNNKVTSEACVSQFLAKINLMSPINTPHPVADYTGLMEFSGLNAYVFLNPTAIQEARHADELRSHGIDKPLLGVPIAIKDTIPMPGFRNSSGSYNLIDLTSPASPSSIGIYQGTDPGVQRLKDAGAIILGQNNMHEFGSGLTSINFTYGPAKNAHDTTRIAGGSSGGGAVAVAAQIAPVAIGDDLGGSVRVPPALNGVIGFRPTYSRYNTSNSSYEEVPYTPSDSLIQVADGMTVRGVIARSIDDVVLIDQSLSEDGGVTIDSIKRLDGIRLGIPQDRYQNMEPEIVSVVESALSKLEAKGATLVNVDLGAAVNPVTPVIIPGLPPFSTYDQVWGVKTFFLFGDIDSWTAHNGYPQLHAISKDTEAGLAYLRSVLSFFPTEAARAFVYYTYLMPPTVEANAGFEQLMQDDNLDAIIYPTTNLPAAKIQTIVQEGGDPFDNFYMYGLADYLYTPTSGRTSSVSAIFSDNSHLAPYIGIPSLTMPIGTTTADKLPVAMQIESIRGNDARVLEIGSAFEHIFGIPKVKKPKNADELVQVDESQKTNWKFKSTVQKPAPKKNGKHA